MRDLTGRHLATCYMVADMGTRFIERGAYRYEHREIRFGFELIDVKNAASQRWRVNRHLRWGLGPRAKLRLMLEKWCGEKLRLPLDVFSMVGRSAMVELERYAAEDGMLLHAVRDVWPAPGGINWPPTSPTIALSLEPGRFDPEAYHRLTPRLRDRVRESPEFHALVGELPPLPGARAAREAAKIENDSIPY